MWDVWLKFWHFLRCCAHPAGRFARMRVSKCLIAVTRSVICSNVGRKEQPLEIIALIVTKRISPPARLGWLSKVSSIAREKMSHGGGSFQTRDCLALDFLDSREKSSGKQLYEKRERKSGLKGKKKREKAIGKGEGKERGRGGWGGRERSRRKLWKAFPRLREKFVIENRGVYANVRAYLNEAGTR